VLLPLNLKMNVMMKRFFAFFVMFFAVAMLNVGCDKDIINIVDPSNSGGNADEDISNIDFGVSVEVLFSTSGAATVTGTNDDFSVTVNGNDVTIVYSGGSTVMYTLSGTTTDGYFKLYSAHKQGITLNNVSITNKNGAAVNVQGTPADPNGGQCTYVVVSGSNTLADGSSYTDTPSSEDEKAVVFGEGQLVFCGDGSLTVTATGNNGVASDDYLHIMSAPTIHVTSSAGHGLRAKDYILVDGGTIDVNVSANTKKGLSSDGFVWINSGAMTITVTGGAAYDTEDGAYSGTAGIKADGYFRMEGGSVTVTNSGTGGKGISSDGAGYFYGGAVDVTTTGNNYTSGDISSKAIKFDGNLIFAGGNVTVSCSAHEGIESKGSITISDGTVYSYSAKDDAINSAGDFTISGGYVCGHATSNDGLDANGNFYIKGGLVYAIGSKQPEVAIDANTEGGKRLYVQGGTIIAIGGLENNSSLTQSCYSASSWSSNTWYALTVGSNTYAFKTPSNGGTTLVVSGASTPSLKSSVTVSGGNTIFNGTLTMDGTVSGGSSVSLSSYTGGNGGGGHGPGPGGW
jgi:hypothetical protein